MTLMLIALWIAGHTFKWYWLIAAVALDLAWVSIKLNFMAVLVRRSVEDALYSLQQDSTPSDPGNTPPPPQAG
jgi:hypothetical protein